MTRMYPLVLAVLWFTFAAFVFVTPSIARAAVFGWVAVLMGVLNLVRWGVRRCRKASG